MSALKIPINYKCLEEELHVALAADELYKLQNDAKIRAVEQGVPTYEHFRQMVINFIIICVILYICIIKIDILYIIFKNL